VKITHQFMAGLAIIIALLGQAACNENELLDASLVPVVDNINTFATDTFTFNTINAFTDSINTGIRDSFTGNNSTSIFYLFANFASLGTLSGDPIFGKINGGIGIQLRQPLSGLKFPSDSISIDSLVLDMPVRSTAGDTASTATQTFNVYQLNTALASTEVFYNNKVPNYSTSNLLGSKTLAVQKLDSFTVEKNKKVKSIRIALDTNFARKLVNLKDTVEYKTFEAFNQWFKGIYITPQDTNNGAALASVSLQDITMKLYYRSTRNNKQDTLSFVYIYNPNNNRHFNRLVRNYNAPSSSVSNYLTNAVLNDSVLTMQSELGAATYITLPYLAQMPNNVINKAELVFTVLPTGNATSDSLYKYPRALRLTSIDAFGKPITLEGANTSTGAITASAEFVTINGIKVVQYKLQVTKAIQKALSTRNSAFKLLLRGDGQIIPGAGRAFLGGVSNTLYKAKLNVIYTRIK
jgi:hypothetical protein